MRGLLHLSWRHLVFHWRASVLSVLCLATTIFLPLATRRVTAEFERALVARAADTPLVAGVRGNRFDLTLAALYFRPCELEPMRQGELAALRETPRDVVVPLDLRHRARGLPVVATAPEYFERRGLAAAEGGLPLWIGECVLGANALADEVGPGDTLFTDARDGYDLAGAAPLELTVAGRLAPTGGPDDGVVFTTVETGWMLAGALHGHGPPAELDASKLLGGSEEHLVVGPALVERRRAEEGTRGEFHLHADPAALPVSAALIFPADAKARTMLRTRVNAAGRLHVIDPGAVVEELLGIVFRIRGLLDGFAALLGGTTVLMGALVILLGLRLRAGELRTLERIGASRGVAFQLVTTEVVLVLLAATLVALAALGLLRLGVTDLLEWIA